jgi:glycosyltransferase involved in cell wall biosynthesis
MSIGIPAIVPDIPINREISSNSALFFDFSTKDKFSSRIKLLKNPQKRSRIIAEQKKAAQKFSWDKSTTSFLKALKK